MTCLDEQANIGIHERHGHRHILAIRQDSTAVGSAFLDEAENIVPSKNSLYETTVHRHECLTSLPSTVESG